MTPARPETAARCGIALQGTGEAVLGLVGELLLPSCVATSQSSTAPTGAELVADVLPVTLRPLLGVHHVHHVT